MLALGKEGGASANQHRINPYPGLVDETQSGSFGGEGRAADRDIALPRVGLHRPLPFLARWWLARDRRDQL